MKRSNIYCTILQASLLCLLAVLVQVGQFAGAQLLQNMQKLKIPSDVIPVTGDTRPINVQLNGNAIKPGDPVPAKNFKSMDLQKISWEPEYYDSRYTFMLVDLDRKPGTNGTLNIYNQFTSINIPGNQLSSGQNIVGFDPPNVPCHPSTKHRLVMLAFRQDQNIDLLDVAYLSAPAGSSPKRENLKLDEVIKRHRLELEAANIFLAIGEANGICSGSMTIHSLEGSVSISLISMVIFVCTLVVGMSDWRSSL